MGGKEWEPANVLDVFGDPVARATLIVANKRPVAVKDLADELNVSNPTIYRRIEPLVEANLLKEYRQIDGNGNQHHVYETMLDEVTFSIADDGYEIDIQIRQDVSDDFESMWTDLEVTSTMTRPADQVGSSRSDNWNGDPS